MSKDKILSSIYEELFPWINEGIAKIQEKHGMTSGDCSMGLDMEFREAFDKVAECTYKQLVENGAVKESEVE